MGKIVIDDIDIHFEKKPIKNMYLRIKATDGKVKMTVPVSASEEDIKKFVLLKISWIKKRRKKLADKPRPVELNYVTGETLWLLGKQYPLNVQHGSVNTVFVNEPEIILQLRNNTTKTSRAKIIEEWYRDVLKKIVPVVLEKWEKTIGVKITEWKIQNMRTKWGTCNIRERRIVLNLHLAKRSPDCLEFVIIHELIHLLEKSHGAQFKQYMDVYCPNWKNIRKSLASNLH
ncbi:MAG: M48 family metallopeptidase [Treponema sp.]|nr:M48 family metallopeptidase [Treponema sp.]